MVDTPSADRLLQELRVIHESSLRLHHLQEPEALARDVIALLQDVVPHDFAAVYLIDGDKLTTFSVSDRGLGESGLQADKRYLESLHLRVGENITGWVALHGEPVIISNAADDPRYLDARPGVRSELCVPMHCRDRITGVINLESLQEAAYCDYEQRLLEILASQIAIAIDNAQLLERTREYERLKILAELTGGIAHDLGNLLQVTVGAYDLLLDRLPPETVQPFEARQVELATDKAIELTRGLLRIGRPALASDSIIDLGPVLHAAAPLLNVLAGPGVAVNIQTAPTPCAIRADASTIEQILMNLVVNARQAMPEGGRLTVSTMHMAHTGDDTPGAGHVRLRVRDTGCGMDTTARERALEPYFTTRADGTGLGLSTVARLVGDLGGRMDIDSSPDQGTTVNILLPFAE